MKKEVLIWIVCILILASSTFSQPIDYKIDKESPILEMYLYSWGLGETTDINLDDYFSIKRNAGDIYISSAPEEISIYIDQKTGIAKLTPRANWLGTRRVIFMITNENIPPTEAKKKLDDYAKEEATISKNEDILRQIELNNFKNDTLAFEAISKLLENLKSNLGPEAKVTAVMEGRLVKLDVGKNVKLDVGFEKKVINNITTEKPSIVINVTPKGDGTEQVEGSGPSLIVILPIVFIILSLIGIAGFYIKDHYSAQISRFISKFREKTKQIDLEKSNYLKIKHTLSEIEKIEKIEDVQLASKQFFIVIKEFFKALIKPKFSEAYSGLDKTIMLDSIDEGLKDNIIIFSKEIYDIKFSGKEIDKKELKTLVSKSKSLISIVLSKKKRYLISEEKKQSWVVRLLEKLKEGKKEVKEIKKEVKKSEKAIEIKEKIGIIKILKEKINLFKSKEEKIKEKIEEIKEEKLKEKKEKLKESKIKEKKEELEKLKSKERKRKIENIKKYFKKILHDKLNLYKTEEEKIELKRLESLGKARNARERQLEETKEKEEEDRKKREKKREEEKKEQEKRERKEERKEKAIERKRKIKKFLHNYLGLYKNKLEIEKLRKINAIEKAKETREKNEKEKQKEREKIRREYEEEVKKKEKEEKAIERNKEIKKFLHNYLGLYKTEEEKIEQRKLEAIEKARETREKQIEKRKGEEEKERRKISLEKKEEEIKEEFKEKEKELKKSFKNFIHHKLGLFRTPEEKIEDLKRIKQKRIERLKELKRNFIAEEIENLKAGEELTSEQKVKILEKELRISLNRGEIERAKKIDKEMDRLYQTLPKKKEHKQKPNIFTKLRDRIREVKFKPGYKEFKEKILHPIKEQKKERVKEDHIKDLEKQTQKLLEDGNIEKAESFYTRASELLKNTESKIKKIANKEAEEIGDTTKKIEEEIKEKFDRLTSPPKEKPKQAPIKDNTRKIEKIISDIKTHVGKDLYKAKELYTKASSEFKKIPEELPETTHQRLYNQLKPLKNEILRQSIPKLMKELKSNLSAGKIEKAKEIQEQIDDIYTYLAKQEGISYTSTLITMIEKANGLIKANKINEAKDLYKKITEKYDSLSQMEKQKYYKIVFDLYNKLIR